MTDERGSWRPSHLGDWLGDNEDMVNRDESDDDAPLLPPVRHWNPVTYRCAFCGASFQSRAMIRRHLARHARERAAPLVSESDELKAA